MGDSPSSPDGEPFGIRNRRLPSKHDWAKVRNAQWWASLHDVVTALQMSRYFLRLKR
jgi:hypothetical protein